MTATPCPNDPFARSIWRHGRIVGSRTIPPTSPARSTPVGLPNPNRVHVRVEDRRGRLRALVERRSRPWPRRRCASRRSRPRSVSQPIALWSASSTWVRPPSSLRMPVSLIFVFVVTSPFSRAATDGQHLEHRARLVDGADDRIDEARRVARRDRPSSRCRRTTGRTPRRGSRRCTGSSRPPTRTSPGRRPTRRGSPARRTSWSPASIVRRRSSPGVPGSSTTAVSGIWRDGDVPLGLDDPRPARELLLVVLLDAVLADAVAVDEAEELRGEGRVRGAAGLRVDADRLRLERQALRASRP